MPEAAKKAAEPAKKAPAKKLSDGEIRDLYNELEVLKLAAAGKALDQSKEVADLKKRIRDAEADR